MYFFIIVMQYEMNIWPSPPIPGKESYVIKWSSSYYQFGHFLPCYFFKKKKEVQNKELF